MSVDLSKPPRPVDLTRWGADERIVCQCPQGARKLGVFHFDREAATWWCVWCGRGFRDWQA